MTPVYVQCRWYRSSSEPWPYQWSAVSTGAVRQTERYRRLGLVHRQPTVPPPVVYRRTTLLAGRQRSQRHSVGGGIIGSFLNKWSAFRLSELLVGRMLTHGLNESGKMRVLKLSCSQSLTPHSHLSLAEADLEFDYSRYLAVTGGRLNQPSWLLDALL